MASLLKIILRTPPQNSSIRKFAPSIDERAIGRCLTEKNIIGCEMTPEKGEECRW